MQMGRYQLVRKLATGGMAEVFLAKAAGPRGFAKTLVVKRILPHLVEDPQFTEMFLSEARLAAQLNHSNIVQIFDFGEEAGSYFIAMEYIDGPSLRVLLKRAFEQGVPIPLPLCAKIISSACEGLSYAHQLADPETGQPLHIVHRDISPDNILLSRNGDVKVVDFGIAKTANQIHRTKTGTVKGKAAYMPPEQLTNKPLDQRADVFALGVVLYEVVTGQKPFQGDSEVSLMHAIIFEPLVGAKARRADVPEELDRIIGKALTKDRDERYQSCRGLQADLDHFLMQSGTPVGPFQLSELIKQLVPPPVASAGAEGSLAQGSGEKQRADGATPPGVAAASTSQRDQDEATLEKTAPVDSYSIAPREDVAPQSLKKTKVWRTPAKATPALIQKKPEPKGRAPSPTIIVVAVASAILLISGGGYFLLRKPRSNVELATTDGRGGALPPVAERSHTGVLDAGNPTAASSTSSEARTASGGRAGSPKVQQAPVTRAMPPKEFASLLVESSPKGEVRINDKLYGTSPVQVDKLAPGNVRIQISGDRFKKAEAFVLKPGENVRRLIVEKGRLFIWVRPEDAEVTLDEKPLGSEPPPQEVYEGAHQLKVVHPVTKKKATTDCYVKPKQDNECRYVFKE